MRAAAAAFTTSVATFRFPTRRNFVSLGSFSASTCCLRGCRTIMCSQSSSLPDEGKKKHPWLIVGLGNPGRKYEGTRHNAELAGVQELCCVTQTEDYVVNSASLTNHVSIKDYSFYREDCQWDVPLNGAPPDWCMVGFELVDTIAEAEGISMSSVSFKSLFGKGFIGNVPVILAKPQTFMNASGESVGPIVSYYKIPLKQVLVVFDDLDLPFAKLRLLPKGGHGGHNGMKIILNHLKGSRDFPRLRIGIGRPPGKMDPVNFVLRPFNKQEHAELDFTFGRGLEAVRILVEEGFDKGATLINTAKSLEQLR